MIDEPIVVFTATVGFSLKATDTGAVSLVQLWAMG
jgi:hypothetical protein